MQFSDEELIAFLLADAPSDLEQRIRSQLDAGDSELIERLAALRMILGHIDSVDTMYEPPSGLVEGTLDRIDAEVGETGAGASNRDAVQPAERVPLSTTLEAPRSRRTLWDSTALALSLSLLCCLALPAMVRARFEARREQCSENLRATGRDLVDYATMAPDGRFPRVSNEGPMAFAGIYALHLYETGRLESWKRLSCPSLLFSGVGNHSPRSSAWNSNDAASAMETLLCDLSIADLGQLPDGQLAIIQFHAGGDFAYNLGVYEEPQLGESQRPVPPKHAGRSYFAILADAPLIRGTEEQFLAHDGFGINILYDDGGVRFVKLANLTATTGAQQPLRPDQANVAPALLDHPFRNLRGQHQVGLNTHDASLAPSHFRPLGP